MHSGTIDFESMSGRDFEDLVEQLIRKMGFFTEERKRSADGGIDIHAINEQPILKGEYIIQCKKYTKPIGVSFIRELFGVVISKNANKGILITNSSFTKDSMEFAKKKQLELIDGEKLILMLADYDLLKGDKIEVNVPNAARVLKYSLIEPQKKLIKEFNDLKSGFVMINKKTVTMDQWFNVFKENSDWIGSYAINIESLLKKITIKMNSNEEKDVVIVQELSKHILNSNRKLNDKYKELLSYSVPELLSRHKQLYLSLYEENVNQWVKMINNYDRVFNNLNEIKENVVVDMTISFLNDKVVAALTEMSRIQTNIREARARDMQKQKSGCFIVTATYGSPLSDEVNSFRRYRDNRLQYNIIGEMFIKIYYTYSPFYADLIRNSNTMKIIIRKVMLEPLLILINKKQHTNKW